VKRSWAKRTFGVVSLLLVFFAAAGLLGLALPPSWPSGYIVLPPVLVVLGLCWWGFKRLRAATFDRRVVRPAHEHARESFEHDDHARALQALRELSQRSDELPQPTLTLWLWAAIARGTEAAMRERLAWPDETTMDDDQRYQARVAAQVVAARLGHADPTAAPIEAPASANPGWVKLSALFRAFARGTPIDPDHAETIPPPVLAAWPELRECVASGRRIPRRRNETP
jgi:hypothetical protein